MRRTSLVLFVIAPLLLLLLLVQLANTPTARTVPTGASQAASLAGAVTVPEPEQTDPDAADPAANTAAETPAADEVAPGDALTTAVPLSPALSVRIRSQVPFTVAFALAAAGEAVAPDAVAAPDDVVLSAEPLTTSLTTTLTPTLPATRTTGGAGGVSAGVRPGAVAAPVAAGEAVTSSALITGADLLTDVLIPLTTTLATTAATSLDDAAALTLTAETTGTGAITGAEVATLDLPEGLLESEPATTTVAGAEEVADAPLLTVPSDLLTETVDAEPTATPAVAAGIPMTLDFDIQVLLTNTLTSTVPATLVIRLNGMPTMTVPISVVFGTVGTALVNVEPVTLTAPLTDVTLGVTDVVTVGEVITLTPSLTVTEEPTDTDVATPTVDAEATPEPLTVVTVTVPVTTNVRPGPGVNFDPVRTVPPNSVLEVVAIDQSREWLLLTEGNWIAVVVLGEAPAGLPVANTALVEQVRAEAALRTPTPTPTPQPPTVTPTPLPPSGPVTGTTTTNANLRSGPGTTFEIVGNTVLGQVVTIVTRNEAGDWLQLDTGSWVSASLVAGLPAVATLPVFDPNATPTPALVPTATPPAGAPVTGTVAATGTPAAPLLPTATPSPGGAAETPVPAPAATPAGTPAPLSVEENLYLVEFDTIARKYDLALTGIDRLVNSASGNASVLTDPQWGTDMTTAIQLLRSAGSDVTAAVAPPRFTDAHASLTNAAGQYNSAADSLAAGLAAASVEPFTDAFSAITLGDAQLAQASTALSAFRP